jgi:hypothetical protein
MPDRLLEQAKVLADRVGGLSAAVEQLDRRTNRSERVVIVVTIVLALTIITAIALGVAFIQLRANAEDVAVTQAREARTRQEALCPLYSLILGNFNPESRPEGPDREKYIEQFDVMRRAHRALDCAGPLVPPPLRR